MRRMCVVRSLILRFRYWVVEASFESRGFHDTYGKRGKDRNGHLMR